MAEDRWMRVLSALAAGDQRSGARLCTLAVDVLGVSGAGVAILSETGEHPMTVCSSDPVARVVEDLQFSLGEGPCVDAFDQNHAISVPDLAEAGPPRWPAFTPPAVEAGAAAVFGFPLRAGGVRIGALNLYRDQIGGLSDEEHADALIVADVIAREIVAIQAHAEPGTVSAELLDDSGMRVVVFQASGMVSVQLGVGVDEALLRIRAYAYSHDLPITVVASRVVDRTLHFE